MRAKFALAELRVSDRANPAVPVSDTVYALPVADMPTSVDEVGTVDGDQLVFTVQEPETALDHVVWAFADRARPHAAMSSKTAPIIRGAGTAEQVTRWVKHACVY